MAPPRHHAPRPPPQSHTGSDESKDDDEDEDDYMTMAIPEVAAQETPLQRLQRQRREALARGAPKSRSELAAEESARREAAHSRSMLEGPEVSGSKGLAMMAKMGFRGGALGRGGGEGAEGGKGVTEPIRVFVKGDRGGVGLDEERKKREREVEEEMIREGKRAKKVGEGEYRERVRREREMGRVERQYRAAAKLAQQLHELAEENAAAREPSLPAPSADGMSDEDNQENKQKKERKKKQSPSVKLRSINVLWRGLVKEREAEEKDRAARRALEEGLVTRLPTYEEDDLDPDDRMAVGLDRTAAKAGSLVAEDLDDEDAELEEFEALEPGEKLMRVLAHLRAEHRWCFWCKCEYPDEDMDGCPGLTEEDHD